jgi:hypothetical protein
VPGRLVTVVVALAVSALAGCGSDADEPPAVPNPASAYCVEQGGTVRIVTAADGSQSGLCRLADGTEVDEWEYYRRTHPTTSNAAG